MKPFKQILAKLKRMRFILIIGIFFLITGIILSFPCHSNNDSWNQDRPVIAVYSDELYLEVPIYGDATADGSFLLTIFPNQVFEKQTIQYGKPRDTTLWVEVTDTNSYFDWELFGNVKAVNETVQGSEKERIVTESDSKKGTASTSLFCFHLVVNSDNDAQAIKLQFNEEKAQHHSNGTLSLRLPIIDVNWPEELLAAKESGFSNNDYSKTGLIDSLTSTIINRTRYYSPHLQVYYHLDAQGISLYDFEMETIYPTPIETGFSPRWEQEYRILPFVAYNDKKWEKKKDTFVLVGGVMIGLGVSLLSSILIALPEEEQ